MALGLSAQLVTRVPTSSHTKMASAGFFKSTLAKASGQGRCRKNRHVLVILRREIPVVVSRSGFDEAALRQRNEFLAQGISFQLWDSAF